MYTGAHPDTTSPDAAQMPLRKTKGAGGLGCRNGRACLREDHYLVDAVGASLCYKVIHSILEGQAAHPRHGGDGLVLVSIVDEQRQNEVVHGEVVLLNGPADGGGPSVAPGPAWQVLQAHTMHASGPQIRDWSSQSGGVSCFSPVLCALSNSHTWEGLADTHPALKWHGLETMASTMRRRNHMRYNDAMGGQDGRTGEHIRPGRACSAPAHPHQACPPELPAPHEKGSGNFKTMVNS